MTDFYVDPSKTNGTGTIGSPFNSLLNATTAATGSNDRIFLARGYVYAKRSVFYGGSVTSKSPATGLFIGPYTAGDSPSLMNPTFNAMTFEPASDGGAGWTHVGGGVWKKAYGATGSNVTVWRVFTQSSLTGPAANNAVGTGYKIGKPIARTPVAYNADEATVLANIGTMGSTAPRLWAHTSNPSGFLYIYTGSSTVAPPAFYGGLALVGTDLSTWGCDTAFEIGDCQRVTIEDVDTIGGVTGHRTVAYGTLGVDTTDIVWNRCDSFGHANGGITVRGISAAGAQFVRRAQFNECVADALGHLDEDWNFRTGAGISWLNGTQDDMRVESRCDRITFNKCVAKDGYHACMVADSSYGSALGTTTNVLFQDCVATVYNRLYGHTLSGVGVLSDCVWDRCLGAGATQWAQMLGGGTIRNCLFYDVYKPYDAYNGQGNVNAEPGIGIQTSAFVPTLAAGSAVFENNTFVQSYGFMVYFFSIASGSIADGAAVFKNNIFVDTQYFTGAGRRLSTSTPPDQGRSIHFALNAAEPIPSVTMQNNVVYTGTTARDIVVYQQGGTITRGTLAAMSGASGNSESDPQIAKKDFRPIAGSPAQAAGLNLGIRLDRSRANFTSPPSIGALEVIAARAAATRAVASARGAASTRTVRA